MVRLAISVEGQTEEKFVDQLLIPHLLDLGIQVQPVLLGGGGGDVSLVRIQKYLNNLAKGFDKVTTLYDFYGFNRKDIDVGEDKDSLESKILDHVSEAFREKVIPYIQMYEFEGLLFSSPKHIGDEINERKIKNWAEKIVRSFNNNPELINNSPNTSPSKRLCGKAIYIKSVHGPNIANAIGLDLIREKCQGFNSWLSQLESLTPI